MDNASAAPPARPRRSPFPSRRSAVAVVVVAGLFLLFRLLPIAAWIEEFKTYVRGQGALGYVIFGLVYIGASLIPGGPAAIMTLAAGAVYGLVTGTILVSLSSITAATLAFLLARGAFRQRVQKIAEGNKTFGSLNRAIEKEGREDRRARPALARLPVHDRQLPLRPDAGEARVLFFRELDRDASGHARLRLLRLRPRRRDGKRDGAPEDDQDRSRGRGRRRHGLHRANRGEGDQERGRRRGRPTRRRPALT